MTIGGLSAIHHFTTVGRMAYVGGMTRIVADVPPYMISEGNPCEIRGYNRVAMRRWNCNDAAQQAMRETRTWGFSASVRRRPSDRYSSGLRASLRPPPNSRKLLICAASSNSRCTTVSTGGSQEIHRRDTDEDRRSPYEGGRAGGTS